MEVAFGIFSVTSIISGTLAAIFIKRFNSFKQKLGGERKYVTNNQLGMVLSLTVYDGVQLIAKYFEVFAYNGKVSRWDGEWYEGWFQLPVFIALDLSIVNGISWTLWLWERLSRTRSQGLTRRLFENVLTPKGQIFLNRSLIVLVLILHCTFAITFSQDPGRLYTWCCLVMILYLGLVVILLSPMVIDLFFLMFEMRNQSRQITEQRGTSSSAITGVLRVFVSVLIAVVMSPIGIYITSTTTIVKRSDRIFRNLRPEDVNSRGDGIYAGPGITPTILVYALFALIMSIPFLFRKEFIPTILGRKPLSLDSKIVDVKKTTYNKD